MAPKILKALMIVLVLSGIAISVPNFLPKVEASSIWGTTTEIDSPEELWHYYQKYGIAGLASRHIEDDYYCVDDPSNCVIVI